MEANIEQFELFPFLLTHRTAERSPIRQFLELTATHGPLVTPALAAATIGVTKQRVQQFMNEGRLPTVRIDDHPMIPAAALNLFMSEKRGSGVQPKNQRKGFVRTMFSEASAVADRLVR
jgi:hypothetical protein